MAQTTSVSLSNGLSVLLTVTLLAALIGCGPAPAEEASRTDRGIGSARGLSTTGAVPHLSAETIPLSSAARSAPLASQEQSLRTTRDQPEWIAKELDSPDVSVRLRALDRWVQQGPTASLDPLVVGLGDEDEAVRAKAMALLEQQLAIEPEGEEVKGEQ